ncbi:hypothetical protein DRE_01188 [Drechslerella stenobrocha 248]|uniref:V-type proton ATPase subunit C n=1 Tax=Drechslerella stenobrocha 248 TaxID=1043628 RepID=W7HWA5_9PEZI|nr:hypothetical protein DRE_01188 [Drechslerella stenobrocha 248]
MSTYLLLSLPTSIVKSGDKDDAFNTVKSHGIPSETALYPFAIPDFKIGTLDTLVIQADELAKLDAAAEQAIAKSVDVLKAIFDGNETRISENKKVNDKTFQSYLQSFAWNKVKYRADRPIPDIVNILKAEIHSLDEDIKSKYSSYQSVKANLQTLQRRQQGNLSTRSLASILKPSHFLTSEYLTTALIAVPKPSAKEFTATYETMSPMVVPRSAFTISEDAEFILFGVVVFKKHAIELSHKARELRYVPRDVTYSENASDQEQAETKSAEEQSEKLWGETLHLARTGYSELAGAWIHVKTLRMFVESVLRYGLPLDFVSGCWVGRSKAISKVKDSLEGQYAHLGGNAYGKDKKGNIMRKDDANVAELAAGTIGGTEYTPFVEYLFEIA